VRKAYAIAAVLLLLTASAGICESEKQVFPAIDLIDANGEAHSVKSYFGAATVLTFWATWCGPCRIELPELQRLYNELAGKGFAVVAINVDSPKQLVEPFMKAVNLTMPVAFVDPETEIKLGIDRVPFSVLLDREGRVVMIYEGYSKEAMEDLRQRTRSLLAEHRGRGGK
jgi:thiol-disulfide isomerase/thioredoxin